MGTSYGSAPGLLAPLAALACLLGLSAGQANVGIAFGTSLVVGLVAYAALSVLLHRERSRRSRGASIDEDVLLASVRPDEAEQLERSAIRLSDRLDATLAELAVYERRASRAEEQVRDALRLLEAVSEQALPSVQAIEAEARGLLGGTDTEVDRRGPAGRIMREAASLHTRLADIAALAEIDGAEVRRHAVPSELASLLEGASSDCPHVETRVDESFPRLLMIERITFGHAMHDLFAHFERKGASACRVEASAQPAAGDLFQVEIRVSSDAPLTEAELRVLVGGEKRLAIVPQDSGCGLSLALAARALTRLGGRVEPREGGRVLLIEMVLPLATERRGTEESTKAKPERVLELVGSR